MNASEYHVASFVVSARAAHADVVAGRIAKMAGLEVHGSEHGKLVVTAEASNVRELARLVAGIEALDKVLSVAPVYHEFATDGDAGSAESPISSEDAGKEVQ